MYCLGEENRIMWRNPPHNTKCIVWEKRIALCGEIHPTISNVLFGRRESHYVEKSTPQYQMYCLGMKNSIVRGIAPSQRYQIYSFVDENGIVWGNAPLAIPIALLLLIIYFICIFRSSLH
ncbi:hypothetical protein CDAR_77321 [Caerostris darwini]|uniref:Uncharacterized protein n=1 Tax=Caerostris darwini TaxID=1538125 RepID=A0AAV4TMI6_9ARAC|nr:hypothetical protein CDAR_77321 [Caerostris darwini]